MSLKNQKQLWIFCSLLICLLQIGCSSVQPLPRILKNESAALQSDVSAEAQRSKQSEKFKNSGQGTEASPPASRISEDQPDLRHFASMQSAFSSEKEQAGRTESIENGNSAVSQVPVKNITLWSIPNGTPTGNGYRKLSDSVRQDLYPLLRNALLMQEQYLSLDRKSNSEDIASAYRAVLEDYPQIFYCEEETEKLRLLLSAKSTEIYFPYTVRGTEAAAMCNRMTQAVERLCEQLCSLSEQSNFPRQVVDYFTEYTAKQSGGWSNTAYGVLVEQCGDKFGIAKACALILRQMGYSCDVVYTAELDREKISLAVQSQIDGSKSMIDIDFPSK